MSIDVLPRVASISLLTDGTSLRLRLADTEWGEIAAWVGDLPLALDALNSSLRLNAITPAELLARCRSESVTKELSRQMRALQSQIAPGTLRGVTSALAVSYDALQSEAQRAARLLSWFGSEPVPLELFHALGSGIDKPEVRVALTGHSILSSFGSRADHIEFLGTMHRVMADYIRNRVRTPRRDLVLICNAFANVMTPERVHNSRHWPLMNACLPHAERVFWGVMAETQEGVETSAGLARLLKRAAQRFTPEIGTHLIYLGNLAGRVLYHQHRYEAALRYAEVVHGMAVETNGPDSQKALEASVGRADVIRMTGNADRALKIEESVLPRLEQLLGPKHRSTLLLMNNLAVTLNMKGDHEGARRLFARTLEAKRAVLGPDDSETLATEYGLAFTAYEAGDYQRARELYEATLNAMTRVLGPEHHMTLITRHGLAATLYEFGQYKQTWERFISYSTTRSACWALSTKPRLIPKPAWPTAWRRWRTTMKRGNSTKEPSKHAAAYWVRQLQGH